MRCLSWVGPMLIYCPNRCPNSSPWVGFIGGLGLVPWAVVNYQSGVNYYVVGLPIPHPGVARERLGMLAVLGGSMVFGLSGPVDGHRVLCLTEDTVNRLSLP